SCGRYFGAPASTTVRRPPSLTTYQLTSSVPRRQTPLASSVGSVVRTAIAGSWPKLTKPAERAGFAERACGVALLVVLRGLLRRHDARDHLLAVHEHVVLGRVLVGHVVAGAAVDAVDLAVGGQR